MIEVLVDARHYEVSVFEDVISIKEEDYSTLDVFSVKFSICRSPACIDLGQISVFSSIIIHEAVSNPVLFGVLGNAIYDLIKYMGEKIPNLLNSCKHVVQSVPIGCSLTIKHKEETNIKVNLNFSSDELKSISKGLVQLKETIETLDLTGEVEMRYEDSKWHVSN